MDAEAVRNLLDKHVRESGSLRKWAKQYNGEAAFACRVINGEREPSDTILNILGLERVVTYRKKGSKTNGK